MKNENYFNVTENTDYIKLTVFNEQILHLNQIGQTPHKYHTDASGYTSTSRYFNMELKDRDVELVLTESGDYIIKGTSQYGKPYTANTLFIEQHKISSMMLDYVTLHQEPIYINFLKDGVVVVFNLSKLKRRPFSESKTIKSRGYNKMEIGQREGLYLTDATIYKMDNNNTYQLIKRPE